MTFIVYSDLDSTDCAGCWIYRRGKVLLAKPYRPPNDWSQRRFVSLPIKVAEFADVQTAETALRKVRWAIEAGKESVDITQGTGDSDILDDSDTHGIY